MTITLPQATVSELPNLCEYPPQAEREIVSRIERLLSGRIKFLASEKTNTKLAKQYVADSLGTMDWDKHYDIQSNSLEWNISGLSLMPSDLAGIGNLCPHASAGCKEGCLVFCGLASVFESIKFGRLARTMCWHEHRGRMLELLANELAALFRRQVKTGIAQAVRLNMFSDIPWEKFGVPQAFPTLQFYDYSKYPTRFGAVLPNYWVTFSLSETNALDAEKVLNAGGNVAVVFADSTKPYVGNRATMQDIPEWFTIGDSQWPVWSADSFDHRFLDPRARSEGGLIAGLVLKAPTKVQRNQAINSGFAQLWR